jgi:glycosyltransferase involved in cell wall biosynthesis
MVILPARNEGPRVGAVVTEVRRVLPGVEVVVVENGSVDDTAQAARLAGATVLRSATGYAIAQRVGFAYAHARGAPWCATLDADGQHPPAALPQLIAALAGADLVVGSRFLGDAGYPVAAHRRLANSAFAAWASVLVGQSLTDVTSGLRAMRAPVLAAFAADYPPDVADANVIVRAVRAGWRVREVPVAMRPRLGGRSMHDHPRSAWFAIRMLQLCAEEAFSAARA